MISRHLKIGIQYKIFVILHEPFWISITIKFENLSTCKFPISFYFTYESLCSILKTKINKLDVERRPSFFPSCLPVVSHMSYLSCRAIQMIHAHSNIFGLWHGIVYYFFYLGTLIHKK